MTTAQRGFTLTELVIVLVITGVLAAVAVPRLFNQKDFAARAAHDFTLSTIRYAQKTAIAMRRSVCVAASSANLTLTYSTAAGSLTCSSPNLVSNPGNGVTYSDPVNALPGGVTFAGTYRFIFDATGRPLSNGPSHAPLTTPQSISVIGYAQPVTVEPETGLVR